MLPGLLSPFSGSASGPSLKLMPAKAYAFSPCLIGRLTVAEVVEVLEFVFRFVLVFRVTVGLRVVLGNLVVSRVGVAPVLFVFWFLEFIKEIDGVDELFFRDFMLIFFPLLLHLCVKCINSAFTGHSLFQWAKSLIFFSSLLACTFPCLKEIVSGYP